MAKVDLSIQYQISLDSNLFLDKSFTKAKHYNDYFPLKTSTLTSAKFDDLTVSSRLLLIHLLQISHKYMSPILSVYVAELPSFRRVNVDDLFSELNKYGYLEASKLKENKIKIKQKVLSNTNVLDACSLEHKNKGSGDGDGSKKSTGSDRKPQGQKTYSTEIVQLYENYYPKKEGKTAGVKKLSKEVKTENDLIGLQVAIKNYAASKKGSDKRFLKLFSTFASEWRDWVDHVPEQFKKEETYASPHFEGIAGVE